MEPESPRPPQDVQDWLRIRRRAAKAAVAALVLLTGAAAIIWRAASRPKPRVLTWTITAPGATPLKDGSRPEPLRVEFSDSAAKLEDAGKPVKRGVSLTPFTRGAWAWAGDRELVFTPSEDWPAGREYSVRLDRALLPAHLRADTPSNSFKTAPFTAALVSAEFSVDPRDPRIKRVAATFRFSHPVDADAFEKRLTMNLLGPKKGLFDRGRTTVAFTVSYDKFRGEAYAVSEPLAVPAEAAVLEVRAAKGLAPQRGASPTGAELTAAVNVPGMYDYFHINGITTTLTRNERLEPEEILIVESSAGVGEKELAGALRAWVLPSTRPASVGQKPIPNYYWGEAAQVGPETLAVSTPVALSPVPAEHEYPARQAFKMRVPPGAPLYVRIPKGTAAYGGYVLARGYDAIARAPEFPREIKILHEGALLRLSGDKKLSLYALGESAVRLEIGRVRLGEINHLASQTEGDFANPQFRNWAFGPDNITERFEEVKRLEPKAPDRLQFLAFDLERRLAAPGSGARSGLFFLRAEGWDPVKKRATGSSDSRFVLVTDLGVLVKENADRTRDVFVQSLADGTPVGGARVEVVGLNGLSVVAAETDASGRARLPDLSAYKRERKPAAFVVRRGEDLSFLPFERQDRKLDDSRFDVGGAVTQGRERELSAYLFSDRGLYRPGETFHVGVLVRPEVWGQDLGGVPLEASILDPRGLEVRKVKFALSPAGFEELSHPTQENGPTGAYQVCVYIVKDGRRGALLGSATVRVEEFMPDRLRIESRFSDERAEGWVSPKGLKAAIGLHNLFGAPAEGRRVSAQMRLTPAAPFFKEYADYAFFDPALAKKSFSERLDDATTDADGTASFDMPLDRFAEGTYRLELMTEGFEAEGGRGVSAQSAVLVSPRPYLVGLKADGDVRYMARGSSRSARAVALGPDGRPVAVSSAAVALIEERWVSALIKQPDGLYRYQSVMKEVTVSTRTLALPAGPAPLRLDTTSPGDYALILRDASGAELNRLRYSVAGHGNLSRSLEKNAELQIRLKKTDYAPGETAELQIKAPYAGAGLIAVERDKVYAHKWFRSDVNASTQSIRIPEGLEGNGYVTVTFLRAPDSKEIFMSPLSHGVAPFTVSRARRALDAELTAPERLKPGETCVLRVSSPRRARVIVFAADEGILQAASWKTPDPLAHFLRKRALEVKTFQILDLLLPEYRLSMALMAAGGDKDGWDAAGRNLNPFKRRRDAPAVYWSGLMDVGPEGRAVSFQIPDSFNGSLRVTALAADADAIGVTTRRVLVRSALVLTPNAPNFAAPGDEFEVGVSVANGVKGSGPAANVVVSLKTSDHLELLGERRRIIHVGENHESVATFRVKARPALGAASMIFEAALSSETARREISLSVRPPVPYQVTLESSRHGTGKARAPAPRAMYPSFRVLEASASPLPLALARGLIQYLQKYPYGCTEQLVSQAFPALVLRHRPEFGYAPEIAGANFSRVIDVLRSRQNEDGAFGFWAANSNVSEFQAVYAAHFLTEAKEKGDAVPPELLGRALDHLAQIAAGAPGADAPPRVRAYAIYILTRNGRVTTALINGLRASLEKSGDKSWRKDLTAAYLAGACALLRLDGQADALIRGVPSAAPDEDQEWFYDESVHRSQLLYLLARHFPERRAAIGPEIVEALVKSLGRGKYNTLSSSYAILALDADAAAVGEITPGGVKLSELREGGARRPLPLPPGLFPKVEFSPAARFIQVENETNGDVYYQAAQSGYDLETAKTAVRHGLEIEREILDEKDQPVTRAKLGHEYKVRLRLRALDGRRVPNVAVVDLTPGGFEPVPGHDDGANEIHRYDYRDVREDRVLFFGAADGNILELTYKIKAAARGRFTVPPPYAESMYDRAVYSYGAGGAVEIE
ncbi:MAG: alpha-2-macroglobulin [Elusimicrobiota bacterium]